MKIKQLDHVAIHVANVDLSAEFYSKVLKLTRMPRPAFDFPGVWFRLGEIQELHLIGERSSPVQSQRRGNHFALEIDDPDLWEEHLISVSQNYLRKRRPDGAHQIFLQDPDGHWIELCKSNDSSAPIAGG